MYVVIIGLTKSGRAAWQEGRGTQEKITVLFAFFMKNSSSPCSPMSFRTQSDWSFSTVLMSWFRTLSSSTSITLDVCEINLHSIFNSGLIRISFATYIHTVLFLRVDPVDPKNTEHKHRDTIDLGASRLAQYMHKAWKKHQKAVYWIDINLVLRKRLRFCQTRSNAIILQETLPVYCIPKVVRMETGEVIHEKVFMSPRPLRKKSLKHGWKNWVQKLFGSQKGSQPNPNPNHDGTGRPVVTGQLNNSSPTLNDVHIDFKISGSPYSIVNKPKILVEPPSPTSSTTRSAPKYAHNPLCEKSKRISGKIPTGERSFWLQRCVDHITLSSPRIWKRTTQTNSILEIPAMPHINFFLQHH